MLSESDIGRIDRAAKSLLEDPGVKIDDEEVVKKLFACGAKPGISSQVVRFPEKMVKEYLSLAPESFFLADRAGGKKEVSSDSPL